MSTGFKVGDRVRVVEGHFDKFINLPTGSEHTVLNVCESVGTIQVEDTTGWWNMSRFILAERADIPTTEDKLQGKIDSKIAELRELKAAFRKAQRELSKLQEVKTIVNGL